MRRTVQCNNARKLAKNSVSINGEALRQRHCAVVCDNLESLSYGAYCNRSSNERLNRIGYSRRTIIGTTVPNLCRTLCRAFALQLQTDGMEMAPQIICWASMVFAVEASFAAIDEAHSSPIKIVVEVSMESGNLKKLSS